MFFVVVSACNNTYSVPNAINDAAADKMSLFSARHHYNARMLTKFNGWLAWQKRRQKRGVMPMNTSKLMPGMGRESTDR